MATEAEAAEALLITLRGGDWRALVRAVRAAGEWLEKQPIGHGEAEHVAAAIVALGSHNKWEVRRAVAGAAAATHYLSQRCRDSHRIRMHAFNRRREMPAFGVATGELRGCLDGNTKRESRCCWMIFIRDSGALAEPR
jgi:hypothetical protein